MYRPYIVRFTVLLVDFTFEYNNAVLLCAVSEPTGVKCGDLYMSFKSILQDVRDAVDWVHFKVRTFKSVQLYFFCRSGVQNAQLLCLLEAERVRKVQTYLRSCDVRHGQVAG